MLNEPKSSKELLKVNLPAGKKHFKLIACEIYYRELCKLIAESEHIIDVEFLQKGLHDIKSEEMCAQLQTTIDAVDDKYDAILLAYGRCNNGVAGVKAGKIPLIIPRVHDCIGALFGSNSAHSAYFQAHPGTFYRSSGWTERDSTPENSVMSQLGLDFTANELIEKYGEDDAKYIIETLGCWTGKYDNITYINVGLPVDEEYAKLTQQEAKDKNLEFNQIKGDLSLLRALLSGCWPKQDFLIVAPGDSIVPDDDGNVLTCKACK